MGSTYSSTLCEPAKVWGNQTSLTGQESHSVLTDIDNRKHQRNQIQALRNLYWSVDSTSDGGVELRPNLSSFAVWIVYLPTGQISRVLLRPNFSEVTIAHGPATSSLLIHQASGHTELEAIRWIESATGLSQEKIGEMLHVTRQTINRWEKGEPLRGHNRKHLFAVRDVLERAALRHPTPPMLAAWLDTPYGSDGRTPAELLRSNEINRARLLAISSPSPRLKRAPSWVNQPIPEAFRAGAERRQEVLLPDTDQEAGLVLLEEEDGTDEGGEDLPIP